MSTVTYLGVEDSVNACDCCGKADLKKTVALDFDGEKKNYGVVCAGRALGTRTRTPADVAAAVAQKNELDRIKARVDHIRETQDVVYGRFYLSSRSLKTQMTIAAPSDLMVAQVYPPPS